MSRGPEDYGTNPPTMPIATATAPGSTVPLALGYGHSVVGVQVSGTWVGTLQFEASQDSGTTWAAAQVLVQPTLQQVSSTTANGNWFFVAGGYTNFRVRASAWTSGTAVVQQMASTANAPVSYVSCSTNPGKALGGTSPTAPGTAVLAMLLGLDPYEFCIIYAVLQGATGGALDVYLQSSPDGGTTWYDIAHYPQLAAAAPAVGYVISLSRGQTANSNAPVVVNTINGTPVLAANNFIPHAFGNALRAVAVAGASTSAGAAQTITALLST